MTSRTEWVLAIVAIIAGGLSPLLLAADFLGVVPLHKTFGLAVLGILVVLAVFAVARVRVSRRLASLMLIGLVAGAAGTVAYDAFRWGGIAAGVIEHDEAAEFGLMIVGAPMSDATEGKNTSAPTSHGDVHTSSDTMSHTTSPGLGVTLLGYAFHYWNGAVFGLVYALFLARSKWWIALAYAVLVVYAGMVVSMGFHSFADFVLEGFGHAAFGFVLWGVTTRFSPNHIGLGTEMLPTLAAKRGISSL